MKRLAYKIQALGITVLALGALSSGAAQAQAQLAAAAAAPLILDKTMAYGTSLSQMLMNFSFTREKQTNLNNTTTERKSDPFFTASLPSSVKDALQVTGSKTRELRCEFHYRDPGVGKFSSWAAQSSSPINGLLGGISRGHWQLQPFWPSESVAYAYVISFDYDARVKGSKGQFLSDVRMVGTQTRITPGWQFMVYPMSYEVQTMGTLDAPIPKIRIAVKLSVVDTFGGKVETTEIISVQGDGRAFRERNMGEQDNNVKVSCSAISAQELQKNNVEFDFN